MSLLAKLDKAQLASLVGRAPSGTRVLAYPANNAIVRKISDAWAPAIYAVAPSTAESQDIRGTFPTAHTLCADLEDVRISHGSMSAAVVEIPEIHPDTASYDKSVAEMILCRCGTALTGNGLLAAVIPTTALAPAFWRLFVAWYEPLHLSRLGDAKKLAGAFAIARVRPHGHAIPAKVVPPDPASLPMPSTRFSPVVTFPKVPKGAVQFLATSLTFGQALSEGRSHGVWSDRLLEAQLHLDSAWNIHPLMPRARRHLGQLIACGAFDNVRLDGPAGPVLLKGQTRRLRTEISKEKVKIEAAQRGDDRTATLTTMRDSFETTVALLHLGTGRFQLITANEQNPASS